MNVFEPISLGSWWAEPLSLPAGYAGVVVAQTRLTDEVEMDVVVVATGDPTITTSPLADSLVEASPLEYCDPKYGQGAWYRIPGVRKRPLRAGIYRQMVTAPLPKIQVAVLGMRASFNVLRQPPREQQTGTGATSGLMQCAGLSFARYSQLNMVSAAGGRAFAITVDEPPVISTAYLNGPGEWLDAWIVVEGVPPSIAVSLLSPG